MHSAAVRVYPNPATGIVNLSIDNQWQGPLDVCIVNTLGQRVVVRRVEKTGAELAMPLDVSRLPVGTYRVLLSDGVSTIVGSFVKVRG